MEVISVMVGRERRVWVVIFEHVELLACCVVGNGAASATTNPARPKVVRRASRLIESVILTRPNEDNRIADDSWNGLTADLASLRPQHQPAYPSQQASAQLSAIS